MLSAALPAPAIVREAAGDEPDDWELLKQHLEGNARAFSQLVRRYQGPVYRLAMRYARDADEAHDLVQRTFMRVFDHAAKLQPLQPFRAFVFRVAANLCKNHIRDRARLVFGLDLEVPVPPGDTLEEQERRRRLRTALARLSLRQRQVVSLRIDAEAPFADIAQSLQITENNAKVTFHNAMKKLQVLIANDEAEDRSPAARKKEEKL